MTRTAADSNTSILKNWWRQVHWGTWSDKFCFLIHWHSDLTSWDEAERDGASAWKRVHTLHLFNSKLSKCSCFYLSLFIELWLDRKTCIRERQSEEEEVSSRPQSEQTERTRQTNGEILTLSWSPWCTWMLGPIRGCSGHQQNKVIRSFINMHRHTHFCTHTSSHQTASSAD